MLDRKQPCNTTLFLLSKKFIVAKYVSLYLSLSFKDNSLVLMHKKTQKFNCQIGLTKLYLSFFYKSFHAVYLLCHLGVLKLSNEPKIID